MNWKSVFECYPDTNEIYVVGDMPFLKAHEAQSHSGSTGKSVVVVTRASQYEDTTALEIQEAADKAKAEQEAADKAKAEQEAADKAKAEQEAADKAKAEQEAADKAKAEQDAADKAKAEQDAAAKAKAESTLAPEKPAKGKGKNK